MNYLFIIITSFLIALILVPISIKISKLFNIYSTPKKGEEKGKPCLGGMGIYIAFLLPLLLGFSNKKLIGIIISSGLIILLGLIDDIKELRPSFKIAGELLGIGILILFGIFTKIAFLPIWLNMVITVLWILFIANAFNLLDIVDGLTSGLVIIISSTLLGISLVNKDYLSGAILCALIGAHLGFLRYNYPPAKVYMGDTGSLFSGLILGAVSINISYASTIERPVALITPILAMSLPIYDTIFLIIMRLKKGRHIFSKTNDHFALRLMSMGHSVHKSIWLMYIFCLFLAGASIITAFGSNLIGALSIFIVAVVFILMGKRVGMVRID